MTTPSKSVPFRRPPRWRKIRKIRRLHALKSGTIPAEKVATTTKLDVAMTKTAAECTCVNYAADRSHTLDAPTVVTIKPFLNYTALADGLSSHPDKHFVRDILDSCINGVSIGYMGLRVFRDCNYWPSAHKFRHKIEHSIAHDVKLGRILGPYLTPPYDNFVASPMGAFQKHSGKIRIITDLSWPKSGSINQYISSYDYSMSYISPCMVHIHCWESWT